MAAQWNSFLNNPPLTDKEHFSPTIQKLSKGIVNAQIISAYFAVLIVTKIICQQITASCKRQIERPKLISLGCVHKPKNFSENSCRQLITRYTIFIFTAKAKKKKLKTPDNTFLKLCHALANNNTLFTSFLLI